MLEFENGILKNNKQRFIEILPNFNKSNIQSCHNKSTPFSLIQKNINTDSKNAALQKKDKRKIENVTLNIKDGTPLLENEVAAENIAKKKSEEKTKQKIITVIFTSVIKASIVGKYGCLTLSKFDTILE